MKLHKCSNHPTTIYTLKASCPKCNAITTEAHYKFIKFTPFTPLTSKKALQK